MPTHSPWTLLPLCGHACLGGQRMTHQSTIAHCPYCLSQVPDTCIRYVTNIGSAWLTFYNHPHPGKSNDCRGKR